MKSPPTIKCDGTTFEERKRSGGAQGGPGGRSPPGMGWGVGRGPPSPPCFDFTFLKVNTERFGSFKRTPRRVLLLFSKEEPSVRSRGSGGETPSGVNLAKPKRGGAPRIGIW